jgi:putative glycosyltransferase (TIGR04348 family)
MLASAYRVRLAAGWDGDQAGDEELMIALHARRSAAAVAHWRRLRPCAPVALVLTGTDLYRDIDNDASARQSLASSDRLIVLNELGASSLPEALRDKAQVVLQSCASRQTLVKLGAHLRALMVGHLRPEKSPQTYFDAARRLADRADIHLDHGGAALDPTLGDQARALMATQPRYRWLGGLSRAQARRRIQQAHVLVHPSRMEGGDHVVIEAVRSGTPVVASHIDDNVGLLGPDYDCYFPVGDAAALATLLRRVRDEPAMLAALQQQCSARQARFDPQHESAALHTQVADLLNQTPVSHPYPPHLLEAQDERTRPHQAGLHDPRR